QYILGVNHNAHDCTPYISDTHRVHSFSETNGKRFVLLSSLGTTSHHRRSSFSSCRCEKREATSAAHAQKIENLRTNNTSAISAEYRKSEQHRGAIKGGCVDRIIEP